MKKQSCTLLVLCVVIIAMAQMGYAHPPEKQQADPTAYEWKKDTIYALDLSQPNTIVQLPVLKLHGNNLAGFDHIAEDELGGLFITREQKEILHKNIPVPDTTLAKKEPAALYEKYDFTQTLNGFRSFHYAHPLFVHNDTAFILLSATPVKQWIIKSPQKNLSIFNVLECALESPLNGEILISYRTKEKKEGSYEDKGQLALVNLETGIITDVPGVTTDQIFKPLTYALWLNGHQMALTFRGRKSAEWSIYEIPSGTILHQGQDITTKNCEGIVTQFFVCHEHLLTGRDHDITQLWPIDEVIQLWPNELWPNEEPEKNNAFDPTNNGIPRKSVFRHPFY